VSAPLFDLDGTPMSLGQLASLSTVVEYDPTARAVTVQARTPNASHQFDVVSLEFLDGDVLMLNLRPRL
jgi:hypothetical protein